MKSTLLKLSGINVSFFNHGTLNEKKKVLDNVNLSVYQGETLAIVGKNGSGKSTLLRVMAGIYPPDSGQVINYCKSPPSLLSLQTGFKQYLTGRENALLSGLLIGIPRGVIKSSMEDIKKYSGLGEYFECPVRVYSTGMRSRLGFSVAMHLQADIILIDETLGVGDIDFQKKSRKSIMERIESNQTVVLVSHDDRIIAALADRKYSMDVNCFID